MDLESLIIIDVDQRIRLTKQAKRNLQKNLTLILDILEILWNRDRKELAIFKWGKEKICSFLTFTDENNTIAMIDSILESENTTSCQHSTWATIKSEYKDCSIKTMLSWWNGFKTNSFKFYPNLKLNLALFIDVTKNLTVAEVKIF